MKLKTPLFLVLFVGSLCLIIFAIWPQFKVIDEWKKKIIEQDKVVSQIKDKNERIASLARQMDTNESDSGFAEKYIPFLREEEKLISRINAQLAIDPVLSLTSFSVEEIKTAEPVQPKAAPTTSKEIVFGSGEEQKAVPIMPSVIHNPKVYRETVGITGRYENIKGFLSRVYALDLMKEISSLEVTSVPDSEGNPTGILEAKVGIDFSYIPQARISADFKHPIFDLTSFDFAPARQLQEKLTERAIAGQTEYVRTPRENPFLPQN